MEVKGKYYNIEKLIENTNGNDDFIHNLIKVFIRNSPVDNFSKLLEKKDFSNLTTQLHKIKSNLPYLAQPEIVKSISKVHLLSLHEKERELKIELPLAINNLKNLIKELNEKFID